MKITLSSKKECHGKKCDTMYTINFDNLRNVDVKSIEIIKNNKVFKTIKFNNKNNNILTISKSDYELLKQNNTLIGDQVIRITYKVKKQEVSVDYYELFNTLNRL